jgi:hypothetical protein
MRRGLTTRPGRHAGAARVVTNVTVTMGLLALHSEVVNSG